MSRRSRRNTKPRQGLVDSLCGFEGDAWQSPMMNDASYRKNFKWIMQLAMNRFRWEGLPDTCNVRYLEQMLLTRGIATIAHDEGMPDVWYSVNAVPTGQYNVYGEPVQWRCMGYNGAVPFVATPETGVIVYENQSWMSPMDTFQTLARKLTYYDRTEDLNLAMQRATVVFEAPEEKQYELVNYVKQNAGFEPVVLGIDGMTDDIKQHTTTTGVEFIGRDLQTCKQNIWNEIYRYLGIDHLAYEKGERMIEEEAKGNEKPTTVKLMDCLTARRVAAKRLNGRFGMSVSVVFNSDYESYNWNQQHSAEGLEAENVAR